MTEASGRIRRTVGSSALAWFGWFGLALAIASVTLAINFWPRDKSSEASPGKVAAVTKPAEEPIPDLELVAADPGYVGPQACAECHAERVESFVSTNHARTCRIPKPGEMPPGFEPGKGTFTSRTPGLRFEMSQVGNDFFQTAIRTSPSGEQRSTARIDFVYGAGMGDDVYLSWRGDELFELPVAWMYEPKKWGASHFNPEGVGNLARELTIRCLECHNTWFQHVPGTLSRYGKDHYVLGVTCENCHGPGREHVAHHQANPKSELAKSIVQPAKLARERQIEVCTQCHSNAMTHRGPAFRYRPGLALGDFYKTVVTKHTEDDHVANQIQYLRESKCFQGNDKMTCTTCHDPHLPRSQAAAESGLKSCRKCHEPSQCGERPRLPEAVQDRCVACHMPDYVKINVNFQTEDDDYLPPLPRYQHRIGIYPTATKTALLKWHREQTDAANRQEADRLAGELAEFWLKDAEQHRLEYRFVAVIASLREAYRVLPSDEIREKLEEAVAVQTRLSELWTNALHAISSNQTSEAIDRLNDFLKVKPDDAKARGRLGTQLAILGDRPAAVAELKKAAELAPDDPYGPGMLGWLEYLDGRPNEALEQFLVAEKAEPYNAKINHQIGLALSKLNRTSEAIDHFKKAVEIDPNRTEACQAVIALLRQSGKSEEAIPYAGHLVKLSGGRNIDAVMTLAQVYAESHQHAQAAKMAERALEQAKVERPDVAPQISFLRDQYLRNDEKK